MALTGKTAPRKRGGNDRNRKRLKKSSTANLPFFPNNNPLFVLSLIPFFIPPLIPPPLFPPVLPSFPSLIPFSLPPGLLITTPLVPFFSFFYDTRP